MNTILRGLFAACLVVLSAGGRARATDPPPAAAGHVLLLDNERFLEGDITREGERYRIRRALGETWVPAAKVMRLCASREDAYHFLRGRANLRDVDERLRLARWCHLHGLREQGLAEARAVLDLRPTNAEAKRLVRALSRPPLAPTEAGPKKEPEAPAGPAAEVTLEALGLFTSKVQPILMNTCASCHAANRGGAFKLVRAFDGAATNHRATQLNLTAVVAQINRDNWPSSPFLVKAVNIHGEATKAPLKGRQAPAFHMLEEWVQLTVTSLPPGETMTRAVLMPAAPPARTFAEMARPKAADRRTDAAPLSATGEVSSAQAKGLEKVSGPGPALLPIPTASKDGAPKPEAKDTPAAKSAVPVDPFDPVIFNQQSRQ